MNGKQTFKIYNRFQKIARNSTFYGNHVRKMDKKALDNKEYICILFVDLSKAFDTINHNLLLANLYTYGFTINAQNLVCSYLTIWKTESTD